MDPNLDSTLLSVVTTAKRLGLVISRLSNTTPLSEVFTPLFDLIEFSGFELFGLLVPDLAALPASKQAYQQIAASLNRLFSDDQQPAPLGISMGIIATALAEEVEPELILVHAHCGAELSNRLRSVRAALKPPEDPNWQAAAARTLYCLRVLVQHKQFGLRGTK